MAKTKNKEMMIKQILVIPRECSTTNIKVFLDGVFNMPKEYYQEIPSIEENTHLQSGYMEYVLTELMLDFITNADVVIINDNTTINAKIGEYQITISIFDGWTIKKDNVTIVFDAPRPAYRYLVALAGYKNISPVIETNDRKNDHYDVRPPIQMADMPDVDTDVYSKNAFSASENETTERIKSVARSYILQYIPINDNTQSHYDLWQIHSKCFGDIWYNFNTKDIAVNSRDGGFVSGFTL